MKKRLTLHNENRASSGAGSQDRDSPRMPVPLLLAGHHVFAKQVCAVCAVCVCVCVCVCARAREVRTHMNPTLSPRHIQQEIREGGEQMEAGGQEGLRFVFVSHEARWYLTRGTVF